VERRETHQQGDETMPTIFTKIINRELPADIVYEDDQCLAFRDINPKAPTHVLLVPKKEIPRLADASVEDQALLGHLLLVVGKITRQLGVDEAFRVQIFNGADAGQTVFHLHLHILGGRRYRESE
jgi:histidine triad (HIT) family protein